MELISKEVVKQIIDSGRTREQMLGMVECAVTFESSTDDCISRKEVLSLPRKRTYDFMGGVDFSGVDVDLIKELPSVKPKERTAHWIHKGKMVYTCSACGGHAVIIKVDDLHTENYVPYLTEWCPKCGAWMIEIR